MIKALLVTLLFPACVFAQGSTTVGDGGKGVVCKQSFAGKKAVQYYRYNLQLLDLYEGRHYHSQILHDEPIVGIDWLKTETANRVCQILNSSHRRLQKLQLTNAELDQAFEQACSLSLSVRIKLDIPRTEDHGRIAAPLPKYCKIVQLGYRLPNGEIWIARNESEYLSHLDLAALLLHEALHPVFKQKSEKLALRQFVMFSFARPAFQKRNTDLASVLLSQRRQVHFRY
jgi:hypothetical protein